jgi:hypothetical protein
MVIREIPALSEKEGLKAVTVLMPIHLASEII